MNDEFGLALLMQEQPRPGNAPLEPGERLFVSGGYHRNPEWRRHREGLSGTLERFIPGQNEEPAAVVRTDDPVSAGGVTGRLLVLELRWIGAAWHCGAVVHIELCDFEPDSRPWRERRQGKWVESHATVRRLVSEAD